MIKVVNEKLGSNFRLFISDSVREVLHNVRYHRAGSKRTEDVAGL